jgi:GTP cyclohydrolase II
MVLWVRRRMREAFREIRSKTARMNAAMNEQVTGMGVIQAYGRQTQQSSEFDAINAAHRDANIKSIKYEAIQDAAIEAVSAIGLASLVMALGYQGASFGTLVAFTAFLMQFFEPIGMLAQRYTLLQSAMSGAERVFSLLDVAERDAPASDASSPGNPELMLELESVSFGYKPEVTVLNGLDLAIRPGEKVAVVGPTGSGKTTILALFQRFYEVFTGDLLGSLKCDCGPQLRAALAQIGAEGAGVLLYLNQEGRGIGLANKLRAYALQDQGFDTVEANHRLGFEDDERDFRIGANMLRRMGFREVRLMTNNPAKVAMMEGCGLHVVERVPLKVGETRFNEGYLRTKAAKSGHLL